LGDTSTVLTTEVEEQRLNALLFDEARDKYTEVAGEMAGDSHKVKHKAQNLGKGVTKAQYVEAMMAFMEKDNIFDKQYTKWVNIAANIGLEDGSKQVCCLKQTCMPTGAGQKYLTTVTDVFLLSVKIAFIITHKEIM